LRRGTVQQIDRITGRIPRGLDRLGDC
jgi:hypothetical protein